MPADIIRKFQKKYGKKKGKEVFYATANKENRSPETFEKKGGETGNRGYLYQWLVSNSRTGAG
jgi:hypothetical protein